MRPLDHKLKYQIDKLVRTAVTGSLRETHSLVRILLVSKIVAAFPPFVNNCLLISAENDPLQLRPNPENLMSKVRPGFHTLSHHHCETTTLGTLLKSTLFQTVFHLI